MMVKMASGRRPPLSAAQLSPPLWTDPNPRSDVRYCWSPLRAVKTEKIVLDNTQSNYYLLFKNYS